MRLSRSYKSNMYHSIRLSQQDIRDFKVRYGDSGKSVREILRDHFATSAIIEHEDDGLVEAMEQARIMAELGKTHGIDSEIIEHIIDLEHYPYENEETIEFQERIYMLQIKWSDPFEAAMLQINDSF